MAKFVLSANDGSGDIQSGDTSLWFPSVESAEDWAVKNGASPEEFSIEEISEPTQPVGVQPIQTNAEAAQMKGGLSTLGDLAKGYYKTMGMMNPVAGSLMYTTGNMPTQDEVLGTLGMAFPYAREAVESGKSPLRQAVTAGIEGAVIPASMMLGEAPELANIARQFLPTLSRYGLAKGVAEGLGQYGLMQGEEKLSGMDNPEWAEYATGVAPIALRGGAGLAGAIGNKFQDKAGKSLYSAINPTTSEYMGPNPFTPEVGRQLFLENNVIPTHFGANAEGALKAMISHRNQGLNAATIVEDEAIRNARNLVNYGGKYIPPVVNTIEAPTVKSIIEEEAKRRGEKALYTRQKNKWLASGDPDALPPYLPETMQEGYRPKAITEMESFEQEPARLELGAISKARQKINRSNNLGLSKIAQRSALENIIAAENIGGEISPRKAANLISALGSNTNWTNDDIAKSEAAKALYGSLKDFARQANPEVAAATSAKAPFLTLGIGNDDLLAKRLGQSAVLDPKHNFGLQTFTRPFERSLVGAQRMYNVGKMIESQPESMRPALTLLASKVLAQQPAPEPAFYGQLLTP